MPYLRPMEKKSAKHSDIVLRIELDKDRMPVKLSWKAEDDPAQKDFREVRAILLSMFDPDTFDTLKIDLWTREMEVSEMDRFVFQSLRAMADTYHRSTKNTRLANEMQKFAQFFGEETEVIPRNEEK